MKYPRNQYVLAVTRGSRTRWFYGEKLGELLKARVKVGDAFEYAKLTTGTWRRGIRTHEVSHETSKG